MMKRFIRRVTAFALSAMLLTAPMAQAQELMTPEGTWLSVEIVVTLGDGSQFSLDVTPVTTTLGSTVYWLDDSMLTDEERAALPNAQLRLVTDTGEIYSEMPLSGTGLENTLDYPISVVNPLDPTSGLTLMRAGYAAPMTEGEADAVLSQFGFETPAPTEEPIIEETPIPTEEPVIEETPIPTEEPVIEETPIPTEEPVIEETPIPTEEPIIEETPIPTEEPTAEPTVELPPYATVNQPETMLFFGANEWDAKGALNPGDVLFVNGYVFDESGRLWYEVADYRSMEDGWVIAEQVTGIDEAAAQVLMAKIDAETAEPEGTPVPTEEPIIEETPIPTEEPIIEETPIPTEEPVIEETPIPTEEPTAEPTVELPLYATVNQPETMLFFGANEWDTKGALNPGDVLFVNGYVFDESGRLWYEVADYRSMEDGWVIAEQVTGIDEAAAQILMPKIDAEPAAPEETPVPTEEPIIEETPIPTEEPIIEETPIPTEEPIIEETPIPTEEPVIEETPIPTEEPAQPTVQYAVTYNSRGGSTNNLRSQMDNSAATVLGEYADGELLLINEVVDDSWYNVTVVRDGMTGYMRNFLVSPISEVEAEKLLAGMEATPAPTEQPTEQPIEQPTEQPIEQPTEQPIEQPTEQPGEMTLPAAKYG